MLTKINFAQHINFLGKKYVIGHKTPDTDSVCSAIAQSNLANTLKTDPSDEFIPLAAGDINKETEFALAYFNIKPPKVTTDLSLKVKDVQNEKELENIAIQDNSSIRELYNFMYNNNLDEVPVVNKNKEVSGIISPKEIMHFNLRKDDILDELKYQKIPFRKFKTLLEARVLAGEELLDQTLKGNVKMGVYSFDTTRKSGLKDAMVLVGDREDIQEEVINRGAKALVITKNKQPSKRIIELAKEKNLIILSTRFGTSSSAKLIEQSYPINGLANKNFVSFEENDNLNNVKTKAKTSAQGVFPITKNGKMTGVTTLDKILKPEEKEVILVDHNSEKQYVQGISRENIKEIIDHHRQEFISTGERIPVQYSDTGATATMIAKNYKANSIDIPKDIAGILWCAIVSDTDNFTSATTTLQDMTIAQELAQIAEIKDEKTLSIELLKQRDLALKNLTPEELVDYDKKIFKAGKDYGYSISQILTFESQKHLEQKERLANYLEELEKSDKLNGTTLMVTDTPTKTTYLIASEGIKKRAKKLLDSDDEILNQKIKDSPATYREVFEELQNLPYAKLPDVTSRKEQVEPFIRKLFEE